MSPNRTRIAIAGGLAVLVGAVGFAGPVLAQADEPDLVEAESAEVEAPETMDADEGEAVFGGGVDCDVVFGDEFDDFGDFDEGFEELDADEIEEFNAETDAIVAHLADNGVTVEVETDDQGLRWPVIADDDATWDLVDAYFEQTYGDELDDFDDEIDGDVEALEVEDLTPEELAELEACFDDFDVEDCEDIDEFHDDDFDDGEELDEMDDEFEDELDDDSEDELETDELDS